MRKAYAQVGEAINYTDSQLYILKKENNLLESYIFGLLLVILLLFVAIFLQWRLILRLRKNEDTDVNEPRSPSPTRTASKASTARQTPAAKKPTNQQITAKQLPDPGLIFKFSLKDEEQTEKSIIIGQKEGNIKTYSTEIIDDHVNIHIRVLDNDRNKDIYNLPDKILEEYQIYLRRNGKTLIYYPGLENFQEMSSRERIYIKQEKEVTGEPTFPQLDPKQPIRLRLGDRLNQDNKFVNGFFEFHLFTQDYKVKTKAGIEKIEKQFFLRLYKIYPGYDTANQTDEGLYPMIDPFTTG